MKNKTLKNKTFYGLYTKNGNVFVYHENEQLQMPIWSDVRGKVVFLDLSELSFKNLDFIVEYPYTKEEYTMFVEKENKKNLGFNGK